MGINFQVLQSLEQGNTVNNAAGTGNPTMIDFGILLSPLFRVYPLQMIADDGNNK